MSADIKAQDRTLQQPEESITYWSDGIFAHHRLMEFGIMRSDRKKNVLVSTHKEFRNALEQKDKLGPGHEVIVLNAEAHQRIDERLKAAQ